MNCHKQCKDLVVFECKKRAKNSTAPTENSTSVGPTPNLCSLGAKDLLHGKQGLEHSPWKVKEKEYSFGGGKITLSLPLIIETATNTLVEDIPVYYAPSYFKSCVTYNADFFGRKVAKNRMKVWGLSVMPEEGLHLEISLLQAISPLSQKLCPTRVRGGLLKLS